MKRITVAVLIFQMLLLVPVFGSENSFDVSYKQNISVNSSGQISQTLQIIGTCNESLAGKHVTLKIWRDGKSESDFTGRRHDKEIFAAIQQTSVGAEGDFCFELLFNEPRAIYRTDIKVQDVSEIKTLHISTADVDSIADFTKKINDINQLNAMTASDFKCVEEHPSDYGADTQLFSRVPSVDTVFENVLSALKASKASGRNNTIDTFNQYLNECVVLEIFNSCDDAATLRETLLHYKDRLNLEKLEDASGIYKLYRSLNDTVQNEVLKELSRKDMKTIRVFLDCFKESVFLQSLSQVVFYNDLTDIIDNNLDYIAADPQYSNLYSSDALLKTYVLKQLSEKLSGLNSRKQFRDAFENAVKSYSTSQENTAQGGGSSGGSGKVSLDVKISSKQAEKLNGYPGAYGKSFTDINGHWANAAIMYLAQNNIVNGKENDTFDPDGTVTRAEFIKMTMKAFKLPNETVGCEFDDLTEEHWAYSYISSAVKMGIVRGTDEKHFAPNEHISRQDMAVILYRTMQKNNALPAISYLEKKFEDFDSISLYAQNSVAYLSNMGAINGSDGHFMPLKESTRAEVAQLLFNILREAGADNNEN